MSVRITLLIAAAQLVLLAGPGMAATYTVPTPGTIRRLQQDCSPRDWLIVSTDSMRWQARVRRFDEGGLFGLRPRDAAVRPPDPLPWTRVERIGVLRSRRTRGVVLGMLVGGVGTAALARSGDFLIGGALGGGLVGGALGGRVVHEEDLYRASVPRSEASPEAKSPAPARPAAASDSVVAGDRDRFAEPPAGSPLATSVARSNPPTEEVDRIALRLHPRDLVRIVGGGTTHYGYVSAVSESGLERFRPETSMARAAEPLDLIPWERVDRLDRRVGSSGSGAKHGAIGFGAAGVVLGMLAGAGINSLGGGTSNADAMVGGGVIGGLTLGAFGGLMGAGVGAAVPKWDPVYERR